MLAGHIGPIALINRAQVAITGTCRTAGCLSISRTASTCPRTGLGHIALAGCCSAGGGRRLEVVSRAAGARPVATLGHVAVSRRRTADRARVARRMGACRTAAVANVFRADVAIVGTGCVVGFEAVRWTGRACSCTALGHIAV